MTAHPAPHHADGSSARAGRRPHTQRRARVQAHIEQAALALFIERGFDSVTVEEIADASAISRRTFFRYFGTKDELLLGKARQRVSELVATFEARPESEPVLRSFRVAAMAVAESAEGERDALEQVRRIVDQAPAVRARGVGEANALMATTIHTVARRLGTDARTDVRPAVVTMSVLQAVHAALRVWLQTPGSSYPGLVSDALDVLEGGLAAAVGRTSPE